MAGTSATLSSRSGGGVSLPAPVVRLTSGIGAVFKVADAVPSSGALVEITAVNIATVSVHGLPEAVMKDIAGYSPQLELLRYVGKRAKAAIITSRNFRNSGYVHPVNGPVASGNGSRTHGGNQPFAIGAERRTEWPVFNWGEVVDVTSGAYAFMQYDLVPHRTAFQTVAFAVKGIMPSGSKNNRMMGKRFPYWGRYKPAYFAFRWSIIDKSDPRKQRITGPMSNIVSLTNEIFPFDPADTDQGQSTATVSPRFDGLRGQFFTGSVSRLPR